MTHSMLDLLYYLRRDNNGKASNLTFRLDVCEKERVSLCQESQKRTGVYINEILERVNVVTVHKVLFILQLQNEKKNEMERKLT